MIRQTGRRIAMNLEVQHDEKARKYYAVADGYEWVCEPSPAGDRALNFLPPYPPPEARGRGIADELVRHALDDVLARGYKVIPSCWFVRVFIDRHEKYKPLLA